MYALDFTKQHYDLLVDTLEKEFPPPMVRQKKGAIKQAITDHFAKTYQTVTLSVYEERIDVLKEFAAPNKNEIFDRAIFRCDLKLNEIKNDPDRYRPIDILWAIPHERRSELFGYFETTGLGNEEIKEQIRNRFEACFELDETEIILFLRNNIYIRKNVAIQKKPSSDRRFVGKSPDELQEICAEYFENDIWSEIEASLPDTLHDRLNFSNITNRRFIKTFIPVYRSMIEIMIMENIKNLAKEDLVAFSGFILRKHFDRMLLHTAKNLLDHIENRDKNAEKFIKYYNGDVVIDDEGKKITQHAIMDSQGRKWNYTAILSTLIQWKETKSRTQSCEEKLKQLAKRRDAAHEALKKAEPLKHSADSEIAEMKRVINDNRKAFKVLKSECEKSSKTMRLRRHELLALRDRDADLIIKLKKIYAKNDNILKLYTNRVTDYNNWEKQMSTHAKQFKDMLEQKRTIKSNYDAITKALIAVFAKR